MSDATSVETPAFKIIRSKKYDQKLLALLVIGILAFIVRAFIKGQIEWKYVGENLFAKPVLMGVENTIIMTVCAMLLGIVLGNLAAMMRMSDNPVLRWLSIGYIWFFRGTPVLLQLLLWFNLALIFPVLSLFGFFPVRTVEVMTPFMAALLGLGIQQGAYTAEVVRAGILSIDKGQMEAAQSIGMTRLRAMFQVVLPQAMRVIVPPIGNETIGMIKTTSLASIIQFSEVLKNVEDVYYVNSRVIELLIVAALWYLLIVTVFSVVQIYVERHFSKGWGQREHVRSDITAQEGA
jgi:polar amino acid transport system permease protein